MAESWIKDDLEFYKNFYNNYSVNEPALGFCALSMMKILNGLSEMAYTQFHIYEKNVLWRTIEVFSAQCIEQLEVALSCDIVEEKKELIEDIQNSIVEIADVYKNIMDGTSNVERQTFQSLALDTNMYELSPKLCAYYSVILKKVVTMFMEEGKEYAFVIHPTLCSAIEAKVLLQTRKKSGKVVIIYVSENVIEEFDLVTICLIHEAFHVIGAGRNRKQRAGYMLMYMLVCMKQLLFENVQFEPENAIDNKIKDDLMDGWFAEARKMLDDFKKIDSQDKVFYGESIKLYIEEMMRRCLENINKNLDTVVMQIVCKEASKKTYKEYIEQFNEASKLIAQIRTNLFRILFSNMVSSLSKTFLFICREGYADIACILTLGSIKPEIYSQAFVNSIQFQYKNYSDSQKQLREKLVAKTISIYAPADVQNEWIKYAKKLDLTLNNDNGRGNENVRRHIVGGANRTLISVKIPLRLCRIGTDRRYPVG